MSVKQGLGPVFTYDMISIARRWQAYATRSGFVLFLLIGMVIAWSTTTTTTAMLPSGSLPTHRQMAEIGKGFYYALAGIQVAFVLLVAPAATAGSICVDRARGTLLHMMVTDLSDAEIVLGRLGAKLVPVFGLLACALPVMTMAGLLGGIDFGALVGLFVVSTALAILGCSLAISISVRASKTHEVLMAVYLSFGLWLLALPIWWGMTASTAIMAPPDWFQKANPFLLVYAPYTKPGFVEPIDLGITFVVILTISAALVGWSILRLRRAVVEPSRAAQRPRLRLDHMTGLMPSFAGPTLDGNPVLWREWHRNRPGRMARWLWRGLFGATWGLAAWGVYEIVANGVEFRNSTVVLGCIFQVFFGLMMVATTSPTVLAEERTRGSLDVLLATPLPTRSIVLGKWWGAYRLVFGLAILPILSIIFLALASPDVPFFPGVGRLAQKPFPLSNHDRWMAVVVCIADFLASGALIVTIGVALATWIPRLGRAVGMGVLIYIIMGIGWPIAVETIFVRFIRSQYSSSWNESQWLMQSLVALSPALGPITTFNALTGWSFGPRDYLWDCLTKVILVKLAGAGVLFWLTLRTFNGCLGRVVESRPASFRPPLGPPSPRANKPRPIRELEHSLAEVSDYPSPLP